MRTFLLQIPSLVAAVAGLHVTGMRSFHQVFNLHKASVLTHQFTLLQQASISLTIRKILALSKGLWIVNGLEMLPTVDRMDAPMVLISLLRIVVEMEHVAIPVTRFIVVDPPIYPPE